MPSMQDWYASNGGAEWLVGGSARATPGTNGGGSGGGGGGTMLSGANGRVGSAPVTAANTGVGGSAFNWGASLPSIPQSVLNFATGVADAASLGLGPLARKAIGVDGCVDKNSGSYTAGQYVSLVLGAGRLAYAGVAKALPQLVAAEATSLETALAVSEARNTLKLAARVGTFPNYRIYTAEQVLTKYGSNADAIINAATRTNPAVNAIGANLAIGAGVDRLTCNFP